MNEENHLSQPTDYVERTAYRLRVYLVVFAILASLVSILAALNFILPRYVILRIGPVIPVFSGVLLLFILLLSLTLYLQFGARIIRNDQEVLNAILVDPSQRNNSDSPTVNLSSDARTIEEFIRHRLLKEIEAQSVKATTNLAVGILAAMTCVGCLFWLTNQAVWPFLLNGGRAVQYLDGRIEAHFTQIYWGIFFSKIALAVSCSVFSFFFLATYRRNLTEIKYFQNELTNVESKFIAIYYCNLHGFDDTLRQILIKSADVERNMIMSEGQRTVDLATKELDLSEISHLNSTLSKILDLGGIERSRP